jgi:hypothetical protein
MVDVTPVGVTVRVRAGDSESQKPQTDPGLRSKVIKCAAYGVSIMNGGGQHQRFYKDEVRSL